jgi:hypothetical protein
MSPETCYGSAHVRRILLIRMTWCILSTDCFVITRYEASTAVKTQVKFFWVVTPCSVAVGYYRFIRTCCLHLSRRNLRNFGILPQHYTAWQPRRPRLVLCSFMLDMPRAVNKWFWHFGCLHAPLSMRDLWWTKWHWGRIFYPQYFGFPLPVSIPPLLRSHPSQPLRCAMSPTSQYVISVLNWSCNWLSPRSRVLLEKLRVTQRSNSPPFMQPKCSLPCSQQPDISYLELDISAPQLSTLFL